MEIHWVHPGCFSAEQRRGAEDRILELARERSDLIDVRIVAKSTAHHRHGGQEVRITCEARGSEIVAARTRADMSIALDEALDVFEREVWRMRHRREQQARQRPSSPADLGIIDEVFTDKGFGFILTDAGVRVYFHRNAVHGGLAFERLTEGQRIELNLEGGIDGPQATVVLPAPPDVPSP